MPKPNTTTYDPFKGWAPHLYDNVNTLGGSTLSHVSLLVMNHYPEESFTCVTLQKRLEQMQKGNVTWLPTLTALSLTIKRLGYDAGLLTVTERPFSSPDPESVSIEAVINRQGQERTAYAALVLASCLKTGLFPQSLIGHQVINPKANDPKPQGGRVYRPMPSCRLGMYALFSTSEEPFSTSEISRALRVGQSIPSHAARPLYDLGVLEKQKRRHPLPTLIGIADRYREPIVALSDSIQALNTPEGILYGLDAADALMTDSLTDFSSVMSLGGAYAQLNQSSSVQ